MRGETKSRFKVFLTHRISQRCHRGFVAGVEDLEPDRSAALPDGMCCAEEAGGFAVTAIAQRYRVTG